MVFRSGALSEHFKKNVKKYLDKGMKVAEFYNGERSEVLELLSDVVSSEGIVYGVDKLNPFTGWENMHALKKRSNVELVKAELPNLPLEITDLDCIVIREFVWTYVLPYSGVGRPEVYEAIDKSIKKSGFLMLHLNKVEQKRGALYLTDYEKTISKYFPRLKKICDGIDLLVFKKMS